MRAAHPLLQATTSHCHHPQLGGSDPNADHVPVWGQRGLVQAGTAKHPTDTVLVLEALTRHPQ